MKPSPVQEALDRLDSLPPGPDRFGRLTGLAQPKKCPKCGGITHSEKLKCDRCGHLFLEEAAGKCPSCGSRFGADAHTCPLCGVRLRR